MMPLHGWWDEIENPDGLETDPAVSAVEDRWKPLFDIAGKDLIDPEAYKEQREYDRLHE